jgi:RNA polymerase sigma-70 factor (ECF subfamily)
VYDLEDLVQDVLHRTLLRWDQLRRLPEAEQRAWLARVAHNCFLDRCRRRASEDHRKSWFSDSEEDRRDDDAQEPQLWEFITTADLRQALERLENDNERNAFELHLQGLSYAEIGKQLGARSGTVGAWLTRARHGLRELLRTTAETRRTERLR